jgi:hypothetical protein
MTITNFMMHLTGIGSVSDMNGQLSAYIGYLYRHLAGIPGLVLSRIDIHLAILDTCVDGKLHLIIASSSCVSL